MPNGWRVGLFGALVLALSACTTQYRNHGYVPSQDDLAQIAVGVDSRATVEEIAGRPTTQGVLDDSAWLYVYSRFLYRGALAPKEVERSIVAISFDDRDVVTNIEQLDIADGRPVNLYRRVTDTNVGQITLWQQLLRNVGQFNPTDFIAQD